MTSFRRVAIAAGLLACLCSTGTLAAEPRSVRGIVVDDHRRPVASARVTMRVRGNEVATTTGADGRFRLEIPGTIDTPVSVGLLARARIDDARLVSHATAHVPRGRVPSSGSTLRLRPEDPLSVSCLIEGAPAPGVRVMLCHKQWSYYTPLEELTADSDGMLQIRMPRGQYGVLVVDPRYAATVHTVISPIAAEEDLNGFKQPPLTLRRPRTVRVRVVDETTGSPIAGAYVQPLQSGRRARPLTPGAKAGTTNVGGFATFERMPLGQRFGVRAWTVEPARDGRTNVDAKATEIELALPRREIHTVRWPRPEGPLTPPPGSILQFRGSADCTEAPPDRPLEMTTDALVLRGHTREYGFGYAVYEERVACHLRYDLEGRASLRTTPASGTFHAVRPFVIHVRGPSDEPVAGARLQLSGRFLLRMPDGRLCERGGEHLVSDAKGRIRGEGVFFNPLGVRLMGVGTEPCSLEVGGVDLARDEPGGHVVRLPAIRDVEAHITIDGERRLHGDLRLSESGMLGEPRYDHERAIARFQVLLAKPKEWFSIWPTLEGYHREVTGTEVPESGPIVVEVRLHTSLTLAVRLDPEEAVRRDQDSIELHRYDETQERWVHEGDGTFTDGAVNTSVNVKLEGHENWRAFVSLQAGRYRLVHVHSGLVHGPFEIDASKPIWDVTMPLRSLRETKGRVEGLSGLRPELGWILEPAGAGSLPYAGEEGVEIPFRCTPDERGAFTLRLAHGEGGRYVFDHPLCEPVPFEVPAGGDEPLVIHARPKPVLQVPLALPSSELVVRMDRSTSMLFETDFFGWPRPYAMRLRARQTDRARTTLRLLRRDTGESAPTWVDHPAVWQPQGGKLLIPVEAPGPHVFVLDHPAAMPVALHPVTVPAEGRVLTARVPLTQGSRIRVTLPRDARDPLQAATLVVTPTSTGALPPFERRAHQGVHAVDRPVLRRVEVAGLPAGPCAITLELRYAHGRKRTLTQAATLDGTSVLQLGPDLRPVGAPK